MDVIGELSRGQSLRTRDLVWCLGKIGPIERADSLEINGILNNLKGWKLAEKRSMLAHTGSKGCTKGRSD